MAVYTLNGAGIQGLTPGTTALYVEVLVMPSGISSGTAAPADYYKVGSIRPGRHGAYRPPIYIDAVDVWISLPDGADGFGYSVMNTGTIRVTEDIGGP